MTKPEFNTDKTSELNDGQLDRVTGGALANPTFRITVFGYGFEFNSRTVCALTPDGGVCRNIPTK